MLWCFGSAALAMVLLALLALTGHPVRLLGYLTPTTIVRGCLALLCLSLALSFGLLAFVVTR